MTTEEIIQNEAKNLMDRLGISVEVGVTHTDNVYTIQLSGEVDTPLIIGKFGETLSSLQRVLEAMLFTALGQPVNILVNVNDYRERQRERIIGIAQNLVRRVLDEGQSASVRSFSAYERKIIHEYIGANHPDLTSASSGEGADRTLTISRKDA